MGQEQFVAIMPAISADLVAMITDKQCISEEEVIKQLYASKLYAALERRRYGSTVLVCCTHCMNRKKERERSAFRMCRRKFHE